MHDERNHGPDAPAGVDLQGKLAELDQAVSEVRASIARYIAFYNGRRPHTALVDRTPDTAYFASRQLKAAA